jgi:hypothetical protein
MLGILYAISYIKSSRVLIYETKEQCDIILTMLKVPVTV